MSRYVDALIFRRIKLRFFADGPIIPNDLLTFRDQGEAVFFCGAGISVPVGLPTFFQLTKQVMSRLGVSSKSKIGMMMAKALAEDAAAEAPPLDRIFGYLQQEYSRRTVEREVNALLRTPRAVDTSKHASILQLSSDSVGNPFVVTTNFDLMFEKVDGRLKRWIGPYLPTLAVDEAPAGIVYLHGRMGGARIESQGLVLGSGDFGRAYLADGWATSFMRDLLERRVVVLLGYSANDPPVRYLLEGLFASSTARLRSIYAFDKGDATVVREKWKELGIVGIGYDQYADLWATLKAWAERATDKAGWVAQSLKIAASPPQTLTPFQRGRIVQLVSTNEGAQALASAEVPPSAEWIYVFDKLARYAPVERMRQAEGDVEVDPHLEYGLDDDPPRAIGRQQDGVDLLESLPSDAPTRGYSRLSNMRSGFAQLEASRLRSMMSWFSSVAHHPAAIWWAARQQSLHPELLATINRRLTAVASSPARFDASTQQIWSLLFDVFSSKADELEDLQWYQLADRIRADGWTRAVFRAFEDTTQPLLKVHPPFHRAPLPPASMSPSDAAAIVRFEVGTKNRSGADIGIPDSELRQVVRILSRSLERGISLLEDIGESRDFFRAPALVPEQNRDGQVHQTEGLDSHFLWLAQLFERLCDVLPCAALEESAGWPVNDGYYFDRLRLHFFRKPLIFDGRHVGGQLAGLSDSAFWNPYIQREILHLLRDRWSNLIPQHRRLIEKRLIEGRPVRDGELTEELERWNSYHSGITLGWLKRHSCALSKEAEKHLTKLRRLNDLKEGEELSADHDWDGRSGWVEQRLEPGSLLNIAVGDIVNQSEAATSKVGGTFVNELPFAGLTKQAPRRAFLALCAARRRGEYPELLWRQLISYWPSPAPNRLTIACGERLANLPQGLLFNARHEVTMWFATHAKQIFAERPSAFWSVWDRIFKALIANGPNALKSAITFQTTGGVTQPGRTFDAALNSPTGRLLQTLFNVIGNIRGASEPHFSQAFRERVEAALSIPGEPGHFAAALLGERLHFLFATDAKWVTQQLLPTCFADANSSAAFWSGVPYDSYRPYPNQLFLTLKANFLMILAADSVKLNEETERQLAGMLIEAVFFRGSRKRLVNFKECRVALQSMTESARLAGLWMVGRIILQHNAWTSFGKPFFRDAWPREVSYRTSSATESLIRMATDLPDVFGDVIDAIGDYLTFVDHPDSFLHALLQKGPKGRIISEWPEHVLTILTRTIRSDAPYLPFQLKSILEALGEADEALRSTKRWRSLQDLLSQ